MLVHLWKKGAAGDKEFYGSKITLKSVRKSALITLPLTKLQPIICT